MIYTTLWINAANGEDGEDVDVCVELVDFHSAEPDVGLGAGWELGGVTAEGDYPLLGLADGDVVAPERLPARWQDSIDVESYLRDEEEERRADYEVERYESWRDGD